MNGSAHPMPDLARLQFYATSAYPCSYLDGLVARSQVVAPSEAVDAVVYNELIQRGFRRSGQFVYRPDCQLCRACQSIRLSVMQFEPNRSQKRAWLQHAELTHAVIAPIFREEHYALYARYQKARHAGSGMDSDDIDQYEDFLINTQVDSLMVEFRLPRADDELGELKMVSIIDKLNHGLSAVYTFFEAEPGQNYGTFNVLWQVYLARALGLQYLYLGYWIENCSKMSYKSRFKPHELYINGSWVVGSANDFTK